MHVARWRRRSAIPPGAGPRAQREADALRQRLPPVQWQGKGEQEARRGAEGAEQQPPGARGPSAAASAVDARPDCPAQVPECRCVEAGRPVVTGASAGGGTPHISRRPQHQPKPGTPTSTKVQASTCTPATPQTAVAHKTPLQPQRPLQLQKTRWNRPVAPDSICMELPGALGSSTTNMSASALARSGNSHTSPQPGAQGARAVRSNSAACALLAFGQARLRVDRRLRARSASSLRAYLAWHAGAQAPLSTSPMPHIQRLHGGQRRRGVLNLACACRRRRPVGGLGTAALDNVGRRRSCA